MCHYWPILTIIAKIVVHKTLQGLVKGYQNPNLIAVEQKKRALRHGWVNDKITTVTHM